MIFTNVEFGIELEQDEPCDEAFSVSKGSIKVITDKNKKYENDNLIKRGHFCGHQKK